MMIDGRPVSATGGHCFRPDKSNPQTTPTFLKLRLDFTRAMFKT
jgi:hypothetical protein